MKFLSKFLLCTILATVACSTAQQTDLATTTQGVNAQAQLAEHTPKKTLIQQVDRFFEDPRFASAFWGVKIKSRKTGEVWYERNANKLFMPASNEKIPTTAATLEILGPDYTFKTTFSTAGTIENGVLKGDLVAWSNGDPTLYSRLMKSPTELFEKLAATLKEKGITQISGNVIGDDNAFDDQHISGGWSHSGLDAWYSAEFGALQLNENYVDLQITPPATADGVVTIVPNVENSYLTIQNNVKVITEGRTSISVSRDYGSRTIVVSGTAVVGGKGVEESPTVPNPTLWYATVLKDTLEKQGIAVGGSAVDIDDAAPEVVTQWEAAQKTVLLEHRSLPLSAILKALMKRSQNLYAETMPRLVAWDKTGKGSFNAGSELIENKLAEMGVTKGEYIYADGSGLSRYNYISPNQLITILEFMQLSPNASVWKETFPIAGVDGTLSNRMKNTPAQGNVRAKTGTISNTRALSGYVTTAEGEELVFSMIVNSHNTTGLATEEVTDGVMALLASYNGAAVLPAK